jgi:hypothetical protein
MDRSAFLLTASLGVALIVLYGFRCWKAAEAMSVATLVNIMLQSSGIVAGLFLISSTILPELKQKLSSLDIYIFIAGMVVCAVSVQGLLRDFLPTARKQPSPLPQSPDKQPMIAAAAAPAVVTIGVSKDLTG